MGCDGLHLTDGEHWKRGWANFEMETKGKHHDGPKCIYPGP